ncbi:hypothetical protein RND81_02G248200 [Saponaria officinalis]|uniref:Transmembrane protein n=1 Tax=Saponaria officinalis TaxID=3572 RepID=A0AAW1MPK3_SAPOF
MMRNPDNLHHQSQSQSSTHQQQSRVFHELSSLILNILRSPPSSVIQFSDVAPPSPRRRRAVLPHQITPAGFASLMLGISLTLMLCGSVTFFLGFLLLPWVIGLVMVFYFVGLVSSISVIGRALLCYATSPLPPSSPPSSHKDFSAWKFM